MSLCSGGQHINTNLNSAVLHAATVHAFISWKSQLCITAFGQRTICNMHDLTYGPSEFFLHFMAFCEMFFVLLDGVLIGGGDY